MGHGIVNRHTAEHYLWGQGCDGWRLLDGADLSIIEERMPPSTSEVLHLHARAEQFFFVLEGEALFNLGGEELRVGERSGLHVPPGIRHCVVNASERDLRFLLVSRPSTRSDRVEAKG